MDKSIDSDDLRSNSYISIAQRKNKNRRLTPTGLKKKGDKKERKQGKLGKCWGFCKARSLT